VGGRSVAFSLSDQWQLAEAHALPVTRSVDDQAADAVGGKVRNGVAVLDLFGDVEAVEIDHRRCGPFAGRLGVGMHQERGEGRALVRNLNVLDAWAADDRGRIAKRLDGFGIDLHAARRLRLQEALAGLVVARGAQKTGRRGLVVPLSLGKAPARLDLVA